MTMIYRPFGPHPGVMVKWSKIFDHENGKKFRNYCGQMVKIGQFGPLAIGKFQGFTVIVNILAIDHGVNSRVSWSWSVPYPPPPLLL